MMTAREELKIVRNCIMDHRPPMNHLIKTRSAYETEIQFVTYSDKTKSNVGTRHRRVIKLPFTDDQLKHIFYCLERQGVTQWQEFDPVHPIHLIDSEQGQPVAYGIQKVTWDGWYQDFVEEDQYHKKYRRPLH